MLLRNLRIAKRHVMTMMTMNTSHRLQCQSLYPYTVNLLINDSVFVTRFLCEKLKFNNLVIENVKEFKYLGVHLCFLEQVLFLNKNPIL